MPVKVFPVPSKQKRKYHTMPGSSSGGEEVNTLTPRPMDRAWPLHRII